MTITKRGRPPKPEKTIVYYRRVTPGMAEVLDGCLVKGGSGDKPDSNAMKLLDENIKLKEMLEAFHQTNASEMTKEPPLRPIDDSARVLVLLKEIEALKAEKMALLAKIKELENYYS